MSNNRGSNSIAWIGFAGLVLAAIIGLFKLENSPTYNINTGDNAPIVIGNQNRTDTYSSDLGQTKGNSSTSLNLTIEGRIFMPNNKPAPNATSLIIETKPSKKVSVKNGIFTVTNINRKRVKYIASLNIGNKAYYKEDLLDAGDLFAEIKLEEKK